MDENKNNDAKQNLNDMNYSFDFANQVDNTENSVTPTTSETVAAVDTVTPDVAPVTPASTVTSDVAPASTVTSDAAPVTPASTVTPDAAQAVPSEVTATSTMPEITPVTPVTPETVATSQAEDESIELIKDKKATKRFLIILFVIILAFIIALPFIFSIAG